MGWIESFESECWSGFLFYLAMVWFNNVVEVFTRPNFYRLVAFFIVSLDSSSIGTALIYIDFTGVQLLQIAWPKKRSAALVSRLAVSKKSTVLPSLSTARYKYFHWPRTLMSVSSSRQLIPTFRLWFLACSTHKSAYLTTHLLIVEWSTTIPRSAISSSTSR